MSYLLYSGTCLVRNDVITHVESQAHCIHESQAHCIHESQAHCIHESQAHCIHESQAHCIHESQAHCIHFQRLEVDREEMTCVQVRWL